MKTQLEAKLINALRHLVVLKYHKKKYGKSKSYIEQQSMAWEYAVYILREIDPEDKFI